MPTTKLGLPTITGNQSADIPRDLNALANAIDEKAGTADGLARLNSEGKVINADGTQAGEVTQQEFDAHSADNTNPHNVTADQVGAYSKLYIDKQYRPLIQQVANLNLQLEASKRVTNGSTFGWNPTTSFGLTIDFTSAKATAQLNAGDTNIGSKVTMEQGTFAIGQKVTVIGRQVSDNAIVKEEVTITAVSPLTVSALTKSYKAGAKIKRTTAKSTSAGLEFGGLDESTTYTRNDVSVTASGYDTSGNVGRKLVRLSNGWLVAVVKDTSSKYLRFYKSTDNGATFTVFTTIDFSDTTNITDVSIVSTGTRVFVTTTYMYNSTVGRLGFTSFDATTVSDFSSLGTYSIMASVDNMQTALGNVSLAINSAGTELHAAWSSKNSTYPNSFNIRYAKGTINGDGSVTWGGVEQVTLRDISSDDVINPSIIVDKNGNPIIFACTTGWYVNSNGSAGSQVGTDGSSILALSKTLGGYTNSSWFGSGWYVSTVYYTSVTSYTQSSPSAIFVPQSVNGLANGRIWVAWHGTDSTDTSAENIRVSYSDDGGATWSSMQKLTTGGANYQRYPSITANKDGVVFVVWGGHTGAPTNTVLARQISYNGSWGSITNITSGYSDGMSTLFDPTFSLQFSQPLFIYKYSTIKVGFYGTFTVGTEAPLTENEVRFTTANTDELVAWVERDPGLTVTASVNGSTMDKTTVSNEDQFVKALSSVQAIDTKLTMTRASTNDNVKITRILGGVA